jgi:hypothetical protein
VVVLHATGKVIRKQVTGQVLATGSHTKNWGLYVDGGGKATPGSYTVQVTAVHPHRIRHPAAGIHHRVNAQPPSSSPSFT